MDSRDKGWVRNVYTALFVLAVLFFGFFLYSEIGTWQFNVGRLLGYCLIFGGMGAIRLASKGRRGFGQAILILGIFIWITTMPVGA